MVKRTLFGLAAAGVVVWGCQNNRPAEGPALSKSPPAGPPRPAQALKQQEPGSSIQRTSYQEEMPLRIDAAALKARLDAGEPATVLDVRWPQAWAAANTKMPGAVHCPPPSFSVGADLARDRLTVVY